MTRTRSQPVNRACECNRIFERGGDNLHRVFNEPALNFRSIFLDRFEIVTFLARKFETKFHLRMT